MTKFFPVLTELLLIKEEEEDITSGLRTAIGALASKWREDPETARKARVDALKKLTPSEFQVLQKNLQGFLRACINKVDSEPATQPTISTLDNYKEIDAATLVFGNFANEKDGAIVRFANAFLHSAVQRGEIDPAQAENLRAVLRSNTKVAITPETVAFFADANHSSFFNDHVFAIQKDPKDIAIDAKQASLLLDKKLEQMTGESAARRPEAISSTVYGLHRVRLNCLRMVNDIQAVASKFPRPKGAAKPGAAAPKPGTTEPPVT